MVVLSGSVIELVFTPGTAFQEPPGTLPEDSSTKSAALTGQVRFTAVPVCRMERTGGTGQKNAITVVSIWPLV